MHDSEGFPSLIDEPEFLAELDKVECPAASAFADRAINVARTTNRWTIRPTPASPAAALVERQAVGQIRAAVPLFLMMLIGICAGAASSALILHDRVARLIALWSH